MTELVSLLVRFGPGVVLTAVALYVVLHGELRFKYPKSSRGGRRRVH